MVHPMAGSVQCHFHYLSLSIKDITRTSKILSNVIDISGVISALIKISPNMRNFWET